MAEAAALIGGEEGAGLAAAGGGGGGGVGGVISSVVGGISQMGSAGIKASAAKDVAKTAAKAQTDTAEIFNKGASERQGVANTAALGAMREQFTYGKEIQRIQNSFDRDTTIQLLGMRSNDYKSAGLPAYLGWQGKDLQEQIPKVIQYAHGAHAYVSKLIGDPMSEAFTGSRLQQYYGWGNVIASYQKSH